MADLDAQKKGAFLAYFVGLFLIIIWDVVEGIVFKTIHYGGDMALFYGLGAIVFLPRAKEKIDRG